MLTYYKWICYDKTNSNDGMTIKDIFKVWYEVSI